MLIDAFNMNEDLVGEDVDEVEEMDALDDVEGEEDVAMDEEDEDAM